MSGTSKRTVSLAPENTAFIEAKVKSGGYASSSEVVRAGLRALQERDEAVERWLKQEVAPTYDAVKQGKSKTFPVGDVFDEIRSRHVSKQGE
ncbi:type II toxin-antitoxin system ParD family antitoxin [Maritalea sp.]|uniref:type II toxin-antitoxin system ParD family antitoxin n=1 Tax=Maritalea sp. TaxID=2003361 RepID=UPI003EF86593